MSTRRDELTRTAARLFAERGFHGTSMGDLAEAMGVQKGSLYSLTGSGAAQETLRQGARIPRSPRRRARGRPRSSGSARAAGHLRVVADQLEIATVFTREWRYLEGEAREAFVAERRRYEERVRALFRGGRAWRGPRETSTSAQPRCSSSRRQTGPTPGSPGRDTDELADRFAAILLDSVRGYATPRH